MNKVATFLLLFLTVNQNGRGQQDSVVDIFPLAVGNKWTYEFYNDNRGNMIHVSRTDTGFVEYQVIGSVTSTDSIRWQFIQRRDFTRTVYPTPPPPTVIRDSSIFEIVELTQGRHELYTPEYDPGRCFPFKKATVDSSRFFRYVVADPTGYAALKVNFEDPANPHPVYDYKCNFIVNKDSGIVQAIGSQFNFVTTFKMRYHIRSITTSYSGPHLTVPTNFTMRVLFGQTKDSSIVVHNWGRQPTQISNVTTSNYRFAIPSWSQSIAPLSDGVIGIRFNASIPETVSASIILHSNSETSPDTVHVRGESIGAAVSSLSATSINFGTVIAGNVVSQSISIVNMGNISMTIDSVRWKWKDTMFTLARIPDTIPPHQSDTITIFYTAPETMRSSSLDSLFIYSNSITSPDGLYLLAYHAPRATFVLSNEVMEFGTVGVGQYRDMIVTITNLRDDDTPYLSRSATRQSCFYSINPNRPDIFSFERSFHDTIRFAPTFSGIFVMFGSFGTVQATFE